MDFYQFFTVDGSWSYIDCFNFGNDLPSILDPRIFQNNCQVLGLGGCLHSVSALVQHLYDTIGRDYISCTSQTESPQN